VLELWQAGRKQQQQQIASTRKEVRSWGRSLVQKPNNSKVVIQEKSDATREKKRHKPEITALVLLLFM
jgi:hypothetical protein